MTAKHATPPDIEGFRKSLAHQIDRNRKTIVGLAALLVIAVLGLILFLTFRTKTEEERWSQLVSSRLLRPLAMDQQLTRLEERTSGDLHAHVLLNRAQLLMAEQEYEKAVETFDRLQQEHDGSYLLALPSPDPRLSLVAALRQEAERERDWKARYDVEPPEVDTTRVALVETDKGAFWIGFFPEQSPRHVENFVAKAKAGTFNGTSVTRVTTRRIDFGGEASKDDDPFNDDGLEQGPALEPEDGRYKIPQARGVVSSLLTDEGESPDRITVAMGRPGFDLDKRQTVFGKVLNDRYPRLTTLDEITKVTTYAKSEDPELLGDTRYLAVGDHPVEPLRILRVTIWKDGAIEDGHEWDVSGVVAPEEPAPAEEPGVTPGQEPGEDAGGQPADGPTEEPAEEPGEQPTDDPDDAK